MYGRLFSGNDRRQAAPTGAVHLRALTAIILLGAPATAVAQLGTGCRIDVTDMDFRQYSVIDPFPRLGRSRVVVDCRNDNDIPTRVTVDAGSSGNPLERVMQSGNVDLYYNLYVDPGRQIVAGDGTRGTSPLIPRLPSEDHNIYLLFGVIFQRQAVPGGEYTDRIRVDLEF